MFTRTNKETERTLAFLLLLLLIPSAILQGFTGSTLVEWFLVPLGFPSVSIAGFIGVSIVLHLAAPKCGSSDKDDDIEHLFSRFAQTNLRYLLSLGMGWAVLQFV